MPQSVRREQELRHGSERFPTKLVRRLGEDLIEIHQPRRGRLSPAILLKLPYHLGRFVPLPPNLRQVGVVLQRQLILKHADLEQQQVEKVRELMGDRSGKL